VVRPARSATLIAGALGLHAASAVLPWLWAVLAAAAAALAAIVIMTALFGPEKFSARAFRLLRRR
jgi:hypothetical protein